MLRSASAANDEPPASPHGEAGGTQAADAPPANAGGPSPEASRLLLELRARQDELEHQNALLRESQLAIEAALCESEAGYRHVLQLSPEAICIHRNEIIFFANDAAGELFAASKPAALIGRNWHEIIAPEYWPRAEQRCGALIRNELQRLPLTEMAYVAFDGRAIPAESTSSRVVIDGTPAIMTVVRDISERKRIEQERREHREHLEDLVARRTADLSAALEAARQSDQAKDAFLANVSHELRTPLSAVLGLCELALPESENPRQRDHLEKIGRAGKHLERVINDLLDLSKIAAGRMTFESMGFCPRALVQHVCEVMAHKAEAKGLQLVREIAADVPDVLVGDPLRVQQVLLNLVGNAIKFTRTGRVAVRVRARNRTVEGVGLLIEIEDTGIGMNDEEMAGLFKPFAQADASMSRQYGGTGLGLAISRHLAELMDGDIAVTSVKGQGTTFSVRLRLGLGTRDDLPPVPEKATAPAAAVRYRDTRVLVVDDHAMNREIAVELLAKVGITATTATNGQEAIDMLAAFGPTAFDLILMDIQMPILDGLAATRLLRTWRGFDRLPVVAMTAHAMAHERESSLDAGFSDHVIKPFDTAGFYGALARWLPDSRKVAPDTEDTAPAVGSATKGLAALCGIDTTEALKRFVGNEERYRHWLLKFVEESPAALAQVRDAIGSGDADGAARAAHAFKGRCGMLGIGELHAIAMELELALRDGGEIDTPTRRMNEAVARVRAAITAALGP